MDKFKEEIAVIFLTSVMHSNSAQETNVVKLVSKILIVPILSGVIQHASLNRLPKVREY